MTGTLIWPLLLASLHATQPTASHRVVPVTEALRAETTIPADTTRESLTARLRQAVQRVVAAETLIGSGVGLEGSPLSERDPAADRQALAALLDTVVFQTEWGHEELAALRESFPRAPLFLRYEADWLRIAGDHEEASRRYGTVLESRPRDVEAQSGLAEARLALADTAGSVAAYTRALELAPEDMALFRTLVRLHSARGTLDLLLGQIDRLRTLHPGLEVLSEHHRELTHRLGIG